MSDPTYPPTRAIPGKAAHKPFTGGSPLRPDGNKEPASFPVAVTCPGCPPKAQGRGAGSYLRLPGSSPGRRNHFPPGLFLRLLAYQAWEETGYKPVPQQSLQEPATPGTEPAPGVGCYTRRTTGYRTLKAGCALPQALYLGSFQYISLDKTVWIMLSVPKIIYWKLLTRCSDCGMITTVLTEQEKGYPRDDAQRQVRLTTVCRGQRGHTVCPRGESLGRRYARLRLKPWSLAS